MSNADRIRSLETGLLFASKEHRPVIQAMIDALKAEPAPAAPAQPAGPLDVIPAGADWRQARLALRRAGHEVIQAEGAVYIDGARCDDPRLRP